MTFPPSPFAFIIAMLALAFGPLSLHAHNFDVSSTSVRVTGNTLHVELEMSAEAAMALYGIPIGTQGTPPNRDDMLPPLEKVAPAVYRFTIDGVTLELREARVEFREEDGIAFLLQFALPIDLPDPLVVAFDARYLAQLPPTHRAVITFVDEHGGVGSGRMITSEKPHGTLPLSRSPE